MTAAPEPLDLFAVAPPGLEPLLARELETLEIRGSAVEGGVAWSGPLEQVRAVNLQSRIASRVLVRLGTFRARSFIELERHAARLPWSRFLSGRPVDLRVSSSKSKLFHQRAIAERLYRSVGVEPAGRTGTQDDEREGEEGQLFVVRVHRDLFTVSADSSGALLHRRGYRLQVARAPLRETLAAALLRAGGHHPDEPLLDPFCGSGTLPIEAALAARRIPPGLAGAERRPRSYAFEGWPGHDREGWQAEVVSARERILPRAPAPVFGSDRDEAAIAAARANAERAGVAEDIRWSTAPLSAAPHPEGDEGAGGAAEAPSSGHGLLATNPPYGQRVSAHKELRDLYAALGGYLRRELPGWRLALLSPDPRLDAQIGLELEGVARTRNGGILVRVLRGGGPGGG